MKNTVIAIFFSIFIQSANAQTGLHYYSTFCSQADDIVKVSDGFIIAGRSACDFMLLKTDENGDSIWQKNYPLETIIPPEFNEFWGLFAMPDGNFLATGLSEDNIGFIMKFTGTGDTIWTKALPYNIQGESFYYTPDGKLWLAGQTNYNTENGGMMADASLIRIDYANGNVLSQTTYFNALYQSEFYHSQALKIKPVSTQDGYIVLGNYGTNGYGRFSGDVYIIRTNLQGIEQWNTKPLGLYLDASATDIEMLPNDEMLVTGYGGYRFTTKLNNQGDTIWFKFHIGGYDIAAHTNGYLLLGHNGLTKIDTSGAILWEREYPFVNRLLKVWVLEDNSLMILGNMSHKFYLIKTDSTGYYQGLGTHSTTTVPISVYPNPAANTLSINHQNLPTAQTVELYNLTGQLVLQQGLQQNNTTISVAGLQVGVYMLQIKAGNTLAQQKVVVWR
ncbi:MAG: T9SS type A sorting domain-containing protein [Sphingobacteriales bacterium]|nr:T9SS type A sorting domain-containing protein [Sphingobacteriales bacterium]